MKTSIFNKGIVLAACLALTSATATAQQKQTYTLTIDLPTTVLKGVDKYSLKVSEPDGVREVADVQLVDGKAVVKGEVDGSRVAYFVMGDNHGFSVPFILECGDISITMNGNFLSTSESTPLNKEVARYRKALSDATAKFRQQEADLKTDTTMTQVEKGQKMYDIMTDEAKTTLEVTRQYCAANKDNAVSALLFLGNYSVKDNDFDAAETLYGALGEKTRSLKEVSDLYARVKASHLWKEGMPMKDVEYPKGTVDGKDVRLSDYVGKGKYVLVDFWASWCSACRATIPYVKATYEALKDKGFDCVSICVWDKRPKSLKAIEEEAMPWTQLIDEKSSSATTYGFNAIPQIMLFSPDGKVLKMNINGYHVMEEVKEAMR